MGLKKRSEVSAEFSMSSLTDIIFLLLIFFMLTSTLVQIHPFELPESDSKTVASTDIVVGIDSEGQFTLNNQEIAKSGLKQALQLKLQEVENQQNPFVTIASEVNNEFNETLYVMKIANELRAKAIIATQPKQ